MNKSKDTPRILHIGKFYPPSRGGIEVLMEQTLLGLRDYGASVSGLVFNEGKTDTVVEDCDGIPITRLGTAFNLTGSPISLSMVRYLRNSDADIVHLHWPNPFALLAFLVSGCRAKLVFAHHSDIIRQKTLGLLFSPFLIAGLRRASSVVVTSKAMIDASPYLRPFRHKCTCIPYGIDVPPPSFTQLEQAKEIRRTYSGPIILSVGRLVYYKGFAHGIRAMQGLEGTLLIVGEGPLCNELKRLSNQSGIRGKVLFLGKINDIRPYYLAADVFVLPSVARSEGFGIVQLEAMADSVPVVNTWLPSTVPIVSLHERTGLTVNPADSNALAEAIRTILADSGLGRKYGRAGKLRYQTKFHVNSMIKKTHRLYLSIYNFS